MIAKALITAGIAAVASVAVATPAFADPASFGVLSCECHDPIPQGPIVQFFTPPQGQIAAGIQQGFSDTGPDVNGVPHS